MKKIGILFLLWAAALTGCQEEIQEAQQPVGGIIQVLPDTGLENVPATDTRAETGADTPLTYTFEAWTRESKPRLAARQETEGTASQVQMNILLMPGRYDFLFWANQDPSCYDSNNLRAVVIKQTGYTPGNHRDAFAGVLKEVTWEKGTTLNITLKRPLAKLEVHNKTSFTTGGADVTFTYRNLPTQYDVLTGKTSQPINTLTAQFSATQAGSALAGEDFLFVPAESSASPFGLDMQVGNITKSLSELELKVNHKTKVSATFE